MATAWIDYRKAYRMFHNLWIVECLVLFEIAGAEVLREVEIRRGILPGDSLSPLSFVLALIQFSQVLRKFSYDYEFNGWRLTTYFLWMIWNCMPRLKEGRLTILSNGTGHTSRYGVLIGTKWLPPGDKLHQEKKRKTKKGKTSCHSCHLTTMVSVSQQIRVYSSSFTTSPTWITCIRDISLSSKESNRLDHCYFCRFSDVSGTEASHDRRVREKNCHFITVQGSQVIRRY